MLLKTGRVYRIICLTNPSIQYIGSTFQELRHRWQGHKRSFERLLEGKPCGLSISPYFKEYGIGNFKMVLIKEYKVCVENSRDSRHLRAYEQLWINKIKCVNIADCFVIDWVQKLKYKISHVEYCEKNKEKRREMKRVYHRTNIERFREKGREYRQNNREKINERNRKYHQNNREKIRKQRKEYYDNNKDKLKKACRRVYCECGGKCCTKTRARHLRTKKHKDYIKAKLQTTLLSFRTNSIITS